MGTYTMKHPMEETIKKLLGANERSKVIAHSRRGNCLWSVREIVKVKPGDPYKVGDKVILLDLLVRERGGFTGYKPMDESMHPYYYSCPLKFLTMANFGINTEWREGVRRWHKEQREKSAARRRGQK